MNILVVNKHSKLEWEEKSLGLTRDELLKKYSAEKANLSAIVNSHEKQMSVRKTFASVFPSASFVMLEDAKKQVLDVYDLIIVLGGDNSFTMVSHYVKHTPILSINSDPDRSVGCLTRWAIHSEQDIYDLAEKLDFNEFTIEEWPRLEATVNGEIITPATSEYFVGERLRKNMSRHVLVYRGKEVEQKCSGLVIATGAGSTGWYKSASHGTPKWKPSDKLARFIATEMYTTDASEGSIRSAPIAEGEELKIYSLNDSDGQISIDSWEEHPFPRGAEAKMYLGKPLHILNPNGR